MEHSTAKNKERLSYREAAEYIGWAEATLRRKVCVGGAPPRYKLGTGRQARVVFDRDDLDRWLAAYRIDEDADPSEVA